MLATNMIWKDLNSQNQYDAGVVLRGLSYFTSADLSRDLANDIMTLVGSPFLKTPLNLQSRTPLFLPSGCISDEFNPRKLLLLDQPNRFFT